ncbi:MAG: cupin [Ponticaulis sp.]|nr:cupin [Ponticaulis sp.]
MMGLLACATLMACEQPEFIPQTETVVTYRPDTPGSNEMLRAPITVSDGLEVLISDVIIPPNAAVPLHYHPGEEFLYLIEGTAIHRQEGIEDLPMSAGDTYVIPPNATHSPIGGPNGARAIVFRVHVANMPERILVDEDDAG